MPLNVYYDEFQPSWEEEGLFARDVNGQLVRVVDASERDYFQEVTVTIDGQPIRLPRAVPTTDAQGNIVYLDAAGRTKPRRTTIYDAALALCLAQLGQQVSPAAGGTTDEAAAATAEGQKLLDSAKSRLLRMIPTVCHLDHLAPAGVCRVCSVELAREETDPKDPTKKVYRGSGKLVPACFQPVEDRMFVNTLAGSDGGRVRRAVKVLLELLAADHLRRSTDSDAPPSEFARLLDELNRTASKSDSADQKNGQWIQPERFAPHQPWSLPSDDTSPLIHVDPNACILCDRCSRACTDVKKNFVIGRTGKGYTTRIGFDLNDAMGTSSCVECGECMLSCPTSALTFREPVEKSDWFLEQIGGENPLTRQRYPGIPGKTAVTPSEMDENELLRTLPWRNREWNQYSVVRWRLKPGQELCRAGDYGATAFLLQSGVFEVVRATGSPIPILPSARILGEMTCLNYYPRSATVRAREAAEVFEVRRNLLFALQRVPESRKILSEVYRQHAIESLIRTADWFQNVSDGDRDAARQFLLNAWNQPRTAPDGSAPRKQVELVQLAPGQIIYREGEHADAFYIIRIGHVKVSQATGGVLTYLRPAVEFDASPRAAAIKNAAAQPSYFGEIGCLAGWPAAADIFPPETRDPRRTATCTALDHVELVRIDSDCFRSLLDTIPALKAEVLKSAARRLGVAPTTPTRSVSEGTSSAHGTPQRAFPTAPSLAPIRREFVEQGLYNSQRLLVLDLEACTRCDECTKACSDTHQGITRLVRDGLRIDKWLVASSCRSCSDPYCLVGCPVDAIHRDGQGKQIQIESHCIGCGLCANNCPYGNINMHPLPKGDGMQQTATTCDLCSSIVGPTNWRKVSCVFACPHNAAFRMTGEELWGELEHAVTR
ncbi:MAG TPA: cyclic nucleotide-binding domain-containing protein [Pirellulaceae bacterium]|jgi:Fe-S-cluster-containing dehydrogenase component